MQISGSSLLFKAWLLSAFDLDRVCEPCIYRAEPWTVNRTVNRVVFTLISITAVTERNTKDLSQAGLYIKQTWGNTYIFPLGYLLVKKSLAITSFTPALLHVMLQGARNIPFPV